MSHQVIIQELKDCFFEEMTTTLPFLPSIGQHIVVDGIEFKVKAVLINYDDRDVVVKGIVQ